MSSGFCKKSFSSLSIQTPLLFGSCCNALFCFFHWSQVGASSSIFCFTYLRTRTKSHTFVIFKTRGLCSQYMLQRLKANVTRDPWHSPAASIQPLRRKHAHSTLRPPVLHTVPRALFSILFVFWRLLPGHKYGEMRIKKHRDVDSLKLSISKYRIGCTFPISMKNMIDSRDNFFP